MILTGDSAWQNQIQPWPVFNKGITCPASVFPAFPGDIRLDEKIVKKIAVGSVRGSQFLVLNIIPPTEQKPSTTGHEWCSDKLRRMSVFLVFIRQDLPVAHVNNPVKIVLVPFLVGHHHDGLAEAPCLIFLSAQEYSGNSGYRGWHRAHRQG